MSLDAIPLNFTGTGRIGNRLFRGEAEIRKQNGKYLVSGSALRGSSRIFVAWYWICGWVIGIGTNVLLFWIAAVLGLYRTSPTLESFSKTPGTVIMDLVVTVIIFAGSIAAGVSACVYILRENITVELPAGSASSIVKGAAYEQSQGENQPTVRMQHATITMRDSGRGICISCRQEHLSALASLLGVPVREQQRQQQEHQ